MVVLKNPTYLTYVAFKILQVIIMIMPLRGFNIYTIWFLCFLATAVLSSYWDTFSLTNQNLNLVVPETCLMGTFKIQIQINPFLK